MSSARNRKQIANHQINSYNERIFITAILLVVTALAFAQNNGADKILGVYLSENKTGKVQITQKDGKYIGTLVWTSIENAKDEKNPDAALRSRTLKGTIILKDMVFVDGIWKTAPYMIPKVATLTRRR